MSVMGNSRNIPFGLHTVAELVLGLLAIVIPVGLGGSDLGIVAGVSLGAVLIGLALSGGGVLERREDRPAMRIDVHHTADRFIGLALLVSAALLGLSGDAVSAITLAAVAALDLGLEVSTRYPTTA
jgi:hypothetical protein